MKAMATKTAFPPSGASLPANTSTLDERSDWEGNTTDHVIHTVYVASRLF